jgi:hypothetical protein
VHLLPQSTMLSLPRVMLLHQGRQLPAVHVAEAAASERGDPPMPALASARVIPVVKGTRRAGSTRVPWLNETRRAWGLAELVVPWASVSAIQNLTMEHFTKHDTCPGQLIYTPSAKVLGKAPKRPPKHQPVCALVSTSQPVPHWTSRCHRCLHIPVRSTIPYWTSAAYLRRPSSSTLYTLRVQISNAPASHCICPLGQVQTNSWRRLRYLKLANASEERIHASPRGLQPS